MEEVTPIKTTGPDWKEIIRQLEEDICWGIWLLARQKAAVGGYSMTKGEGER